ncbi:uncharacterized protein LOC107981721 [Nasonia vitripennis]|uniref:Uncharacterized protein n=1 Tax=Nasonia vitripennis TaxID=7425 RepID=A0A7M7J0N8_NASVI|nr:uncharacterized protein LOC107981721 [Nasonia vitripennis]
MSLNDVMGVSSLSGQNMVLNRRVNTQVSWFECKSPDFLLRKPESKTLRSSLVKALARLLAITCQCTLVLLVDQILGISVILGHEQCPNGPTPTCVLYSREIVQCYKCNFS